MGHGRVRQGLDTDASLRDVHASLDALGILHALPDAVFIVDSSAEISFCNRSAKHLVCADDHDATISNFKSLLDPNEKIQFDAGVRQLIDRKVSSFTFYFDTKNSRSSKRCYEVCGTEFSPGGIAQGMIALSVREIDPGGHSIQFLQTSYGRTAYWNWRNDFATRTTSWPPELCDLIGISSEFGARMSATQVRELLHPRDRYVLTDVYKRYHDERAPVVFHSRIRRANGSYLNVLSHGYIERDESGNPTGFVGFSCDITKEVEADRMLRENEMQLRELVEKMTDLVILRDGEGHMLYVSPAARRLLGTDPSMMVGISALNSMHPDDITQFSAAYGALPVDGEPITITFRFRHADGHYIWLESNVRCLATGPDGRPARIASISRDITERKQAEEALAAARERAEAASATKSRFLANMSHELRTPLNAIIGFSDIIHRELFGPAGNAQYKEYARLIQDSGAHLLDLINDVLDMSKIEAGKFELRLEEVNVEELVRSSMTLMEPHAQKSKLMLVAKLGSPQRTVRADRRAVKQILLNLMSNAVKFTPAGGLVTVSVENLMDGVAIQVSDTGMGIPQRDIERITQPFEQVTADPMLAQTGSGLGLALVHSLIGLHMGRLKIDSVLGEGTVVSVFLPFDPRSRRAA